MIYIIASMPKSGSTWTVVCVENILSRLGFRSTHTVLARHGCGDLINEYNNPGVLAAATLDRLLVIHRHGERFCLKSHEGPNPDLVRFVEDGVCRVTFIIRHPLDIIVSALEYGRRLRKLGDQQQPYYALHSLADAEQFLEPFWRRALDWISSGRALIVRYEDLVNCNTAFLSRIIDYFGIRDENEAVQHLLNDTIDEFSPGRIVAGHAPHSRDYLRFDKGATGRHRTYFREPELTQLTSEYSAIIESLGYTA